MRLLAIAVGIIIVILAVVSWQGANASAAAGTIALAAQAHSAVTGAATLSDDGADTYVIVQATGMDPLATYNVARMDAHCNTVVQSLNPIMASIAGDGNSTSIAAGKPDNTWWFGILSGNTAVACGFVGGSAPVAAPTLLTPTATPGSSLVPVREGTAPVANPNTTPTPLGS